MTVRPSFSLAAAAVSGIALLALALRFQADAADFRARADRLRDEARSLAPDLAARAANDAALAALRRDLAESGRHAPVPADLFDRVLSPAPTRTERPAKRLDCCLDAAETDLDVASADPDEYGCFMGTAEVTLPLPDGFVYYDYSGGEESCPLTAEEFTDRTRRILNGIAFERDRDCPETETKGARSCLSPTGRNFSASDSAKLIGAKLKPRR